MSCMTGCAAKDAHMTSDAGRVVVYLPPRSEFFITVTRITGECRFVLCCRYHYCWVGGVTASGLLLRCSRKRREYGSAVQQCCKFVMHDDPRFGAHKTCATQTVRAIRHAPSSLGQNVIRFGEGGAAGPERTAEGRWKLRLQQQMMYQVLSKQPPKAHRYTRDCSIYAQHRCCLQCPVYRRVGG